MAVFESDRPLGHLTDTRILLMKELERTDLTADQRIQLLCKLADLQLLAKKKGRQRREQAKKNAGKKRSHRKMHDSSGAPLYQDSPSIVHEDSEDAKSKYLSTLKPNENSATE
jgi:hypothetical protein